MASMQSKQVESSSDVEPITQEHVPTILAAASELVTHPSSLVNTAAGLDHGLHVPAASAQVFTDKEKQIRNKAKRNKFLNILRANFAAILVFLFYLISFQTILSCFLTVALTCYWYQYVQNENVSEWSGSNINWVVLGFGKYLVNVECAILFFCSEIQCSNITASFFKHCSCGYTYYCLHRYGI